MSETPTTDLDVNAKPPVSNTTYDWLKQGAQLILPAMSAFYFSIASIWGLPNAEKVSGTIAAVNVLLGVIVYVLNLKYNKSDAKYDGVVNASTGLVDDPDHDEPVETTTLNFKIPEPDPVALASKKEIVLKVNQV